MLKVFMPRISPDIDSIGPPLFPGLMAASVWITSLRWLESYYMAETMPLVMEARTDSPSA